VDDPHVELGERVAVRREIHQRIVVPRDADRRAERRRDHLRWCVLMKRASFAIVVCALPTFLAGCGLIIGLTDREVGDDAGSDAGDETSGDARSDTTPDVRTDSNDATNETVGDTAVDSVIDSATDSATDTAIDSSAETTIDSATDSAIDSVVDSVFVDSGIDSGIDSGVDSGIDTGTDTGVDTGTDTGTVADTAPPDLPCNPGSATVASQSTAVNGPSLAYDASDVWGLVWRNTTATSIQYNAVKTTGAFYTTGTSDFGVATSSGGDTFNTPRIADDPTTGRWAIAWGEHGTGGAFISSRRFNFDASITGAGTLASGPADADASAAYLSDVVVDANGGSPIVVATSRLDNPTTPTMLRVDSFTGTSSYTFSKTFAVSPAVAPNVIASWPAWSSTVSRLVVAFVTNGTPSGGGVDYFDPTTLTDTTDAFKFTALGSSDAPTQQPDVVSVAAGASGNLGVVWLDSRTSNPEIFITAVDAKLHTRVGSELQVSTTSAETKYRPQIVYDGAAFVVTWIETMGAGTYHIFLRRFDAATLTPLVPLTTAAKCITCAGFGHAIRDAYGLAVAGPDDYGVAYLNSSANKQYFIHVTCP
jgi:hypothetical protein